VTCDAWDIIVVPFPFVDRSAQKKRPALVLSKKTFNQHGHSLMAMITTSPLSWPGDSPISDLKSAGLSTPCAVRLKLFTLDNRLILRRAGQLAKVDQDHVAIQLQNILP